MVDVVPNLYGQLSVNSKTKQWVVQIDDTQIALSYSDLMLLGLKIWDVKEQTKVKPLYDK